MNFGKLDRKIRIYTPILTIDSYGEQTKQSDSYIDVWG